MHNSFLTNTWRKKEGEEEKKKGVFPFQRVSAVHSLLSFLCKNHGSYHTRRQQEISKGRRKREGERELKNCVSPVLGPFDDDNGATREKNEFFFKFLVVFVLCESEQSKH